jgi:hypothetical protein
MTRCYMIAVTIIISCGLSTAAMEKSDPTRAVASPADLQTAVADGVAHIVVTNHMDLTTTTSLESEGPISLDNGIIRPLATMSIQARQRACCVEY